MVSPYFQIKKQCLRIIASFTLFCFSSSTAFSAPVLFPPHNISGTHPLSKIALSENLGHIEEIFLPAGINKKTPYLIYLQDAHANLGAQKNIAQIVRQLADSLDIKTIFSEGGSGEANLAPLRSFQNQKIKEEVTRFWLEQAVLTGIEREAIVGKKNFRFFGVEDPSAYLEGGELFLKSHSESKKFIASINGLMRRNTTLRKKYFNKVLDQFETEVSKFESKHNLIALVSYIANEARNLHLNRWKYLEIEKCIDLIIAEMEGGNIERFLEIQKSIDGARLFQEIDALKNEIKGKLFINKREQLLDKEHVILHNLRSMASLEATPQDVAYFNRNSKLIETYLRQSKVDSSALKSAQEFYRSALKRDRLMFQKMNDVFHQEQMNSAFLITGGFHSPGIAEQLRKNGIPFVLISPQITDEDIYDRYFARISGKRADLDEFKSKFLTQKTSTYAAHTLERAEMRVIQQGFELAQNRSELRVVDEEILLFEKHYPEQARRLKGYTIVMRQFEMGIHQGLWDKIGKPLIRFVSQLTMAGGLGALVFDWAEGIRKIVTRDIIFVNLLYYEWIKGQVPNLPDYAQPNASSKKIGYYLKKHLVAMGNMDIDVQLSINRELREAADGKLRELLTDKGHKKIHVHIYSTQTKFFKTPEYYIDAYFLRDESQPDDDNNRIRIFDGLYPDGIWRWIQMAVYGQVSDKLVSALQKNGLVKSNVLFVDNEVYVSLPTPEHPDALRHHENHTAVSAGLPKPPAIVYDLLGYPKWMHPYLVKSGRIHIPTFIALTYDAISGVAVLEHDLVLRKLFFAPARDKLRVINEGEVRSTNGVFFEHWQAPEIKRFIEQTKQELGLNPDARAREVSEKLAADSEKLKMFKKKMEFIKAVLTAKFLIWLEGREQQDNSLWLEDTLEAFNAARIAHGLDIQIEARAVLMKFISRVQRAISHSDQWERILRDSEFNSLKEAILKDPIVSNVRRQVSYKGPDIWLGLLRELENNPQALEEFKKQVGRILIGGRAFDQKAINDFNEMKRLIRQLGLQSRLATLDDYNLREAKHMFRGMMGVVLLSLEFLEAAGTSPAKGISNWAVLLGVWGGANPELFQIVDKVTRSAVKITRQIFQHFYDEHLIPNLGKTWEIVNGWLIKYSNIMGQEEGAGRKPDPQSLLEGLKWLKATYQNPEERQNLLFATFANSDQANLEVGQAPALGLIWSGMIQDRAERQELMDAVPFSLNTARSMFPSEIPNQKGFIWKDDQGTVWESQDGLAGFVEGFHALHGKTKSVRFREGQKEVEVRLVGESISYHASQPVDDPSNIFPYLKTALAQIFDQPNAITQTINNLAEQASMETDLDEKASIYLQAIRLVDALVFSFGSKLFDTYWNEQNPEQAKELAVHFRNIFFKKNVLRYLEGRQNFKFVETNQTGVKAFVVHEPNKPARLLILNLTGMPSADPYDGNQPKVFGNILPGHNIRAILGSLAGDPFISIQVHNGKSNTLYGTYPVFDIVRKGFHFAVPSEDVQVLDLVQGTEKISSLLSAAIQNEWVIEGTAPSKLLMEEIKRLSPEELHYALQVITKLAKRRAENLFTPEGIPLVIAFIGSLAPDLLPQVQNWNEEAFRLVSEVVEKRPDLFRNGSLDIHPTSRTSAIVVSRSIGDQHIFPSFQFVPEGVDPNNGKVRSWVYELNKLSWQQDGKYVASDLLTGERFRPEQPYSGAALANVNGTDVWYVGIPVANSNGSGRFIPRVQFLELTEVNRSDVSVVQRAELRTAVETIEVQSRVSSTVPSEYQRELDAVENQLKILQEKGLIENWQEWDLLRAKKSLMTKHIPGLAKLETKVLLEKINAYARYEAAIIEAKRELRQNFSNDGKRAWYQAKLRLLKGYQQTVSLLVFEGRLDVDNVVSQSLRNIENEISQEAEKMRQKELQKVSILVPLEVLEKRAELRENLADFLSRHWNDRSVEVVLVTDRSELPAERQILELLPRDIFMSETVQLRGVDSLGTRVAHVALAHVIEGVRNNQGTTEGVVVLETNKTTLQKLARRIKKILTAADELENIFDDALTAARMRLDDWFRFADSYGILTYTRAVIDQLYAFRAGIQHIAAAA